MQKPTLNEVRAALKVMQYLAGTEHGNRVAGRGYFIKDSMAAAICKDTAIMLERTIEVNGCYPNQFKVTS